jgi:hypothetical protein
VLKLFYSNRPFVLILIPIFIVGCIVLNIQLEHFIPRDNVSYGLWGELLSQNSLLSPVFSGLIILGNGLLINIIFNRNEFLDKNNYLITFLYTILLSFFHGFYYLDGYVIAQFFLVLALHNVFKLNQNEDGRKTVFNISIMMGIAATFAPLLLITFPFLFWVIWVIRPFVFKESILAIVGFLLPMLYAGLFGKFYGLSIGLDNFTVNFSYISKIDFVIVVSLTILLILFSLGGLIRKIQHASIRLRKLIRVLMLSSFIFMVIALVELTVFKSVAMVSCLLIYVMFILPYAFLNKKSALIPSILFYLLFFYIVGKFFNPFTF